MASADPYASNPGQETTNPEEGDPIQKQEQAKVPAEVVNMDELLAKLRLEMAELSLQGDDFARQMCHMYAIFEEVLIGGTNTGISQALPAQPVGQNTTPALARSSEPTQDADDKEIWNQAAPSPVSSTIHGASASGSLQQRAIFPLPPLKPLKASESEPGYQEDVLTASQRQILRTTALYGSPGVRRKRMNVAPPQRPPRSRDPGKKSEEMPKNHRRSKSEPNCNPLLETISALDYDPGDSDDSFETPPTAVTNTTQEPDRESVGYAGSNSVDSGYKSLCPTPEIPESSYYGGEPILPPPTVCGLTGRRLPPVTQRKSISGSSHHAGSDSATNRAMESKMKSGAQTSPSMSRRSPNVTQMKTASGNASYAAGGANDSSSSSSSPNHRGMDPKPKMGTKAVDFQKHPGVETSPFRVASCNARTDFFQSNEKDLSRFDPNQMVTTRASGNLTNYYEVTGSSGQPSSPALSRNAPFVGRTEYYDVDLDHLMHLRRTLITAIQKCEASMNASISAQKDNLGSATSSNRTSQCPGSPQISRASLQRPRRRSRSISSEMRPKRKESDNSDFTTSGSGDGDSPTSQKSVRFDTDSYYYATNNSKNLSVKSHSSHYSDSGGSYISSKQGAYLKGSKSILKDPLCAGIRSRLSEGATDNVASTDSTFEEEIDALLYGKAEYYDLESVKEFPCSYVTMIEEKYRSGKSSVAKVKRLKEPNNAVKPTTLNLESSAYNCSQMVHGNQHTVQAQVHSPDETKANSAPSGKSKNRFTEVARCMLEILEDIQFRKVANGNCRPSKNSGLKINANSNQRKNTGSSVPSSSGFKAAIPLAGRIQETKIDTVSPGGGTFPRRYKSKNQKMKSDHILVAGGVPGQALVYTSAAEYHVYEEIVYDSIAGMSQLDIQGPNPPPLPARPDGMFHKQRRMSVSDLRHDLDYHGPYDSDSFNARSGIQPRLRDDTDFVYAQAAMRGPPVSGNVHYTTGRSGSAFRSHTYSGNRPKQRSNLYSLFADQVERRNLSQSLEREQRSTNPKDADIDPTAIIEDDYGFRKRCLYPSSTRKLSN